MKFKKYRVRLSEKGVDALEKLAGFMLLLIIIIGISSYLISYVNHVQSLESAPAAESQSGYEVSHVYEDGCFDVYDKDHNTYKFYCEDKSFYDQ